MNELALFNRFFDGFGDYKVSQSPKVDVKEDSSAYTLEMDLPGKTEKDVKIELNNNVLTIASETESNTEKEETSKDNDKWLIKERSFSRFSRSFSLPKDVDSENLKASCKNGVLSVIMPRKELAKPRRIEINVG